MFASFKFQFWELIYTLRCFKSNEATKKANSHLTPGQYYFKMGQEFFNDEACIETLIRNVHKLQSSVAALMEGNEEA